MCRAWLAGGVADEESIDDDFTTTELTIPAGLERLLAALDNDPRPQVWRTVAPLAQVLVWRTAEGDGVDGGAIITAGNLANLVNRELTVYTHLADAARAQTPAGSGVNTVIGVWRNDERVPVGVIRGEHEVIGGDGGEFEQCLWATSVHADDAGCSRTRGGRRDARHPEPLTT